MIVVHSDFDKLFTQASVGVSCLDCCLFFMGTMQSFGMESDKSLRI